MQITETSIRPDAIGIGCRRCASSWLHNVLNQHPSITKPKDGLHFFSDEFQRGTDWYTAQFETAGTGNRVVEYSVSYTYPECCAKVAQRIYEFAPDVKLFATVRHPVDRAFSDYLRSTRMLEIPADIGFEDAIERYPEFLERSKYGEIFAHFYERFPSSQINVLFYEDLKEDSRDFLKTLLSYLELDSEFALPDLERKEPEGKRVQSAVLNQALFSVKSGLDRVMNTVAAGPWQKFKARNVHHYSKVIASNTKPIECSPETRQRLCEYFSKDIERFASLTKRDLSHWH